MPRVAEIISTARYLPEHVVTNAELVARFDALGKPTVIDKLAARTGITRDISFQTIGRHQISLSWRRQKRSNEQGGSQKTLT